MVVVIVQVVVAMGLVVVVVDEFVVFVPLCMFSLWLLWWMIG